MGGAHWAAKAEMQSRESDCALIACCGLRLDGVLSVVKLLKS